MIIIIRIVTIVPVIIKLCNASFLSKASFYLTKTKMLGQVVRKDFIRTARGDSRPK